MIDTNLGKHRTPTVNIDQLIVKSLLEFDDLDAKYNIRLSLFDLKKVLEGLNLIKTIAQSKQIESKVDTTIGKQQYLDSIDGIERLILEIDAQLRVYVK